MAVDPSTDFTDLAELPKHWEFYRCEDFGFENWEATYETSGVRIDTRDYRYSVGAYSNLSMNSRTVINICGVLGVGWGYGGASPTCEVEMEFANVAYGSSYNYTTNHFGIAFKVPHPGVTDWEDKDCPIIAVAYGTAADGVTKGYKLTYSNGSSFTIAAHSAVATPPTSGKMKIARTGQASFTGYYWNGSSWTTIGSTTQAALFACPYLEVMPLQIRRETGNTGAAANEGISVDLVSFTQNSGAIIPDYTSFDPDDDFADNKKPGDTSASVLRWFGQDTSGTPSKRDGDDATPTVTESSGYLGFTYPGSTSDLHVYRSLWSFFPDTDIDFTIQMYVATGGVGNGVQVWVGNFTHDTWQVDADSPNDDGLGAKVGVIIGTNCRLWKKEFNSTTLTNVSSALSIGLDTIHSVRMQRTGSVWSVSLNGTPLSASWTDTVGHTVNQPVQVMIGSDNGTHRFYDFTVTTGDYLPFILDSDGPTVTSQSPANGATEVEDDANITFSINDATSVDLTSIVLRVRGSIIWQGSSPSTWSTGWTGSSYVSNGSNGYDFTLVPSGDALYDSDESITVRVVAEDTLNNAVDTSWSFTAGDFIDPTISNISPASGATGVERIGTSITFSVNDDVGVTLSSMTIYVRGSAIWTGSAPSTWATGWTGSSYVANGSNGYNFTLVPSGTARFRLGETITVRVVADD